MTNTSPAAGRLPVARSRERARTSSKIVWNAPACGGPSRWPRPSFNSAPSISQETSMPPGNPTSNRPSAASTPPGSSFQSSHTQMILPHPAGSKRKQREPEQQVQVRPKDRARYRRGGMQQVMVVVPIDADINETQDVAEEDGPYGQ